MPTYSFDLNPTESVFSIVNGNPLKSPGSIRAKRMATVVNAVVLFPRVSTPLWYHLAALYMPLCCLEMLFAYYNLVP